MQIAICDDIQRERKIIRTALDIYTLEHPKLQFDIDEYSTAMDILDATEKGRAYDIALLDICMPGILGTEAAKEMLAKSPDTGVIFLTTSDEYAVAAFALNAIHYLLKPFSQEQFDAAIDRAVGNMADQDFVSLSCVDGIYRIRISEIVFIESQNQYLLLNLVSGGVLKLRIKLSQLLEEIGNYSGLVKIGASYAANLSFARKISENMLEMQNGAKIPIPRRSSEQVQKAYMDFCRREVQK